MLGKAARGKKCDAIEGLTAEADEIIKEAEDDTVRDAGMLAAAQAVEHYEISRYGTLKAWAEKLGMNDAAALLDETLQEEKDTDAKLTELAESEINIEADEAGPMKSSLRTKRSASELAKTTSRSTRASSDQASVFVLAEAGAPAGVSVVMFARDRRQARFRIRNRARFIANGPQLQSAFLAFRPSHAAPLSLQIGRKD